MTKNINNPVCRKIEIVKNGEQAVKEKHTSYPGFTSRGFTSIDQEMERAIAMQWFSPSEKNIFYHGIVVNESNI
jgi:hypothetical protein